MTDAVILAAVLAAAALAALLWRRRQGRAVAADGALEPGARETVGAPPDGPVLLLFTAPTCGNCEQARQALASVAAARPGVAVAEVDVSAQPAVARHHAVLRAPTVLVIDDDDVIRARVGGVPDPDQLVGALPS